MVHLPANLRCMTWEKDGRLSVGSRVQQDVYYIKYGLVVIMITMLCWQLWQASYGVEDAEFAVVQLAQTTMRSELGKIKLDSVFQERMNLNHNIVGVGNLFLLLGLLVCLFVYLFICMYN